MVRKYAFVVRHFFCQQCLHILWIKTTLHISKRSRYHAWKLKSLEQFTHFAHHTAIPLKRKRPIIDELQQETNSVNWTWQVMAGYSWIVRSTCLVRTDNDGIPNPISAQSHKVINSQTVVRLFVLGLDYRSLGSFFFVVGIFGQEWSYAPVGQHTCYGQKYQDFRIDCITSRPELWTSLLLSIPEFPDTKNKTVYNGLINEAFRGPAQPVSSIYFSFECLFFSYIPN